MSDEIMACSDSPCGRSLQDDVNSRGSTMDSVFLLTVDHVFDCLSVIFGEVDDTSLCLEKGVATSPLEKR
jgi:hypothetical protein